MSPEHEVDLVIVCRQQKQTSDQGGKGNLRIFTWVVGADAGSTAF